MASARFCDGSGRPDRWRGRPETSADRWGRLIARLFSVLLPVLRRSTLIYHYAAITLGMIASMHRKAILTDEWELACDMQNLLFIALNTLNDEYAVRLSSTSHLPEDFPPIAEVLVWNPAAAVAHSCPDNAFERACCIQEPIDISADEQAFLSSRKTTSCRTDCKI